LEFEIWNFSGVLSLVLGVSLRRGSIEMRPFDAAAAESACSDQSLF
jgi:hypothetical protein